MAGYSHEDNVEDARMLAGMLKALYDLPQLTIARVQGAAFGGAVGLVSCCDIAVAEEAASFCLSEVKIGLIPATISPYVVRAIGERAARRYFTTAEHFSANRAQHLGLVSEIVNTQEMDATLEGIINTILRNGPVAVRAAKQLVNEVSNSSINATLIEKTCDSIASIRVSDEGQEGLDAFLNKRQPAWIGE
jgi:methylglutaconyl-CoA hydratase